MGVLTKNTIMVFDADHDDIVNFDADDIATPGFVLSNRDGDEVRYYLELSRNCAVRSGNNPRRWLAPIQPAIETASPSFGARRGNG